MQKGISVIVCCYNSVSRLEETLKHLSLQQTAPLFLWEIIIVDNASTDNTIAFVKEMWNNFKKPGVDFSIIEEKEQGLSFARQRGVEAAKYEYVIFCDDDNWLNDDYLQTAYSLMLTNDSIGAMSGQSKPVSDVEFPEWFKDPEQSYVYVVGKQAPVSGIVNAQSYVWGAGLVTRKSLFKQTINKTYPSILSDRKGSALSSGGDVEYCLRLLLQGYNLYYSDDLKLQHFIPASRLTDTYRTNLLKGIEESRKIVLEYAEAVRIKNLKKDEKTRLLIAALKDFIKSFLKRRKAQAFSYKLVFYFFNIGFRKRADLKMIKQFYNA